MLEAALAFVVIGQRTVVGVVVADIGAAFPEVLSGKIREISQ